MIYYPNAKINIGLRVLDKRPDGYHNIESFFYPIPFFDILEINESKADLITYSGITIDDSQEMVNCLYNRLRKKGWIPSLSIHLHKEIPIGSGLGGGSSDLAFFLRHVESAYLNKEQMDEAKQHAQGLSTDSNFFYCNKPSRVTGKGDVVEPVDLDLSGYQLLLIMPDVNCATSEAYAKLRLKNRIEKTNNAAELSIEEWKDHVFNDFEEKYLSHNPDFQSIKSMLYAQGAIYVSLTGTGSAFYAIFKEKIELNLGENQLSPHRWMAL